MGANLDLRIDSTHDGLEQLNEALDDFAEREGWPGKLLMQIRLVLEELIINVVNYGHEEGETGAISITMTTDEENLSIRIVDDGKPFDPFNEAPLPDLDASLEDRRVGGLGVHLVRTLMDHVEYRRDGEQNCVTISKRLGADDRAEPGP